MRSISSSLKVWQNSTVNSMYLGLFIFSLCVQYVLHGAYMPMCNCVCHVCTCMGTWKVSSSIVLKLSTLDRVSHWTRKLTISAWLAGQRVPRIHLSLPPVLGFQAHIAVPGFLCGCWEFEFSSSCLYRKHSYPLSHLSSQTSFLSFSWVGDSILLFQSYCLLWNCLFISF